MRADRPLRLPLQIGTSALMSLARGSAFFVPGAAVFAAGLGVLWLIDIWEWGDAALYVVAGVLFPGFTLLGFAVKHLRRAHAQRPSDVILDAEGLEVRGGPLHRLRVPWTKLGFVELETPPKPKDKNAEDNSDLQQLIVVVHHGVGNVERLIVAAADRPIEQVSLEELARTLEAARSAQVDEPQRAPRHADVVDLLVCITCGAPLVPSDVDAVTCPHCASETSVPLAIRRRLRDAAVVERRPGAKVASLLRQPPAGLVGSQFVMAGMVMFAAWPIALFVLVRNIGEHALAVGSTSLLLIFVAACIVGCFALIRGRLVDRQALRLVALDFAAQAPTVPGEPFMCRQCAAPLRAGGASVVVRCIYCDADNILGIDLRRRAATVRKDARSLEKALARRGSERARWRGVTAGSVVLLALSGYALRHGIGHNALTWPLEQRCNRADLDACVALADLLSGSDPDHVRVDRKRAARLYEQACKATGGYDCHARAVDRARAR